MSFATNHNRRSGDSFVDCDVEVCPADAVCPADVTTDVATLFKEFGGSLGDDDDDELTYKTYLTYDARLNPIEEHDGNQEAIVVYNHTRKHNDIENRSIHINTTADEQDMSTLSSASRTTATPSAATSPTVPRSNRNNNKKKRCSEIDNNNAEKKSSTHNNNNDSSTTSEEQDSSSSSSSSSQDNDSTQYIVGSSSKSSSKRRKQGLSLSATTRRKRLMSIIGCCFILIVVLILIIVLAVTKDQRRNNENKISDPLSTPLEQDNMKSSTSSSFDEYDEEDTSSSTVAPAIMDPTTLAPTTNTTNSNDATSGGTNESGEEEMSSSCQDAIIPNTRCYPAGNQDRPIRVFFINCVPQEDDWIGIFGADTPSDELTAEDALDWMWTCGSKDCTGSRDSSLVTFSSNSTNREGMFQLHMIRRNSIYNGGNDPNNNLYSSYASSTTFEIKVNTRDCIEN